MRKKVRVKIKFVKVVRAETQSADCSVILLQHRFLQLLLSRELIRLKFSIERYGNLAEH